MCWWSHEDWAVMSFSQRLKRVCACHILAQHKPAWLERILYRYHLQQLRKDDAAARRARQWEVWKRDNPCYYRMMVVFVFLLIRAVPLLAFSMNTLVFSTLLDGPQVGWFLAHVAVFLGQFIVVSVLFGHLLFTMLRHATEDATPLVDNLVRHGRRLYWVLGPFLMGAFDCLVILRFMCSEVKGDLIIAYWRLRTLITMAGSALLFGLNVCCSFFLGCLFAAVFDALVVVVGSVCAAVVGAGR